MLEEANRTLKARSSSLNANQDKQVPQLDEPAQLGIPTLQSRVQVQHYRSRRTITLLQALHNRCIGYVTHVIHELYRMSVP